MAAIQLSAQRRFIMAFTFTCTSRPVPILNSTPVAATGYYRYVAAQAKDVRRWLAGRAVISFVGHQATAQWIERHLGIACAVSRGQVVLEVGVPAVVVRLRRRRADARGELATNCMNPDEYEVGLLMRIANPYSQPTNGTGMCASGGHTCCSASQVQLCSVEQPARRPRHA